MSNAFQSFSNKPITNNNNNNSKTANVPQVVIHPSAQNRLTQQVIPEGRNAFAALKAGALRNPTQNIQLHNQQKRKQDHKAKEELQTKRLKDENDKTNKQNDKLQRQVQQQQQEKMQRFQSNKDEKMENHDEEEQDHSSHIVPRDWLSPEFPYDNHHNKQDISVCLLMLDAREKRIGDIPPHLLENTTLPEEKQRRTNIEPVPPYGKNLKQLAEDPEWQNQLNKYKKGPQRYHVQAPVIRMKSVCENGCEVLTNAYGVRPRGSIPIPKLWAQEILKSSFPELGVLLKNPDFAKYNDGTRYQLPEDRRKDWPKIRNIRDQILQSNPVAKKYCEMFKNALETRIQIDDQNLKHPQLRYLSGDYTSAMILKVTPRLIENLWGYNHNEQIIVFEITFAVTKVKQLVRKLLISQERGGLRVGSELIHLEERELFNFVLSLEMQFLIDHQLTGMTWYTLPSGKYQLVTGPLPEEEQFGHEYLKEDDEKRMASLRRKAKANIFQDVDVKTAKLEGLALAADFEVGYDESVNKEEKKVYMEEHKANFEQKQTLADTLKTKQQQPHHSRSLAKEEKQSDEKNLLNIHTKISAIDKLGGEEMNIDEETGEELRETRLTDDERAFLEQLNATQAADEASNANDVVHRSLKRKTWLRAEMHIHCTEIQSHYRDPAWEKMPNLRTLAFDIECASKGQHFPRPGKKDPETDEITQEGDPVISISCVMQTVLGKKQKIVMTWKIPKRPGVHDDNDPNDLQIDGCKVIMCNDEVDMLLCFADLIRNAQPSVITGYNIYRFDWKYLLERAQYLGLKTFSILSPYKECAMIKESIFHSKSMGQQQRYDFVCNGLFSYDLLRFVLMDLKLASNTLNNVSKIVLNQTKNDVSHHLIPKLFYGTKEERERLLYYNVKDSDLVLDIMSHPKQQVLIRNTEICRVTGITMDMLISKGQGVKTESQLFRLMAQLGFMAPNMSRSALQGEGDAADVLDENGDIDDSFTGAFCLEPKISFYDLPIATLDFASLYPSILIAFNLSYDTILLNPEIDRQRLRPEDVERIDVKDKEGNIEKTLYFVKRSARQGLMSFLVEYLLQQRNVVKGLINASTARGENVDLLEGRSLALKLSANAAYGFCAAFKLYMKEISECVCAIGRDGLEATQKEIETHFSPKNGYRFQAIIIYGDTDSVMVFFGVETIKEANKLAEEAEKRCNKLFKSPIRLEFEKVYCLAAESQINLSDGTSVQIKELVESNQNLASSQVQSYSRELKGLVDASVSHYFDQGKKECVELLFNDGRTITCTPDHQIMNAEGVWTKAEDLVVNQSFIMAGVDNVKISLNEDFERCQAFSLEVKSLGVTLNMKETRFKTLALMRLYGLVQTDGCVCENKTTGKVCSDVYLGHPLDVKRVKSDIFLVTSKDVAVNERSGTFQLRLPTCLTNALLEFGASIGKRCSENYEMSQLPSFLTSNDCPLPIQREFLTALFSGDGTAPFTTALENGNTLFGSMSFLQTRLGKQVKNQLQFMENLREMLKRFFVEIRAINVVEADLNQFSEEGKAKIREKKLSGSYLTKTIKNLEELQPNLKYRLVLQFSSQCTLQFNDHIGFRYCCHKQQRLSAIACYYRAGKLITVQKRKVFDRAFTLLKYNEVVKFKSGKRKLPIKTKDALTQAIYDISKTELLHPLICDYKLSTFRAELTGANTRPGDGQDCYAPFTCKEFLKLFDVEHVFSISKHPQSNNNDENQHNSINSEKHVRYGVLKQDIALPTFRLQLIGRRNVGEKDVYDISVPDLTSFVANGLVVHNCPYLLSRKKTYLGAKYDPGFWEKSWVLTAKSVGPWKSLENYKINDAVMFEGSTFAALRPIQGNALNTPPSNGANWLCIYKAKKGLKFYYQGEFDSTKAYEQWDVVDFKGKTYTATLSIPVNENKISISEDVEFKTHSNEPNVEIINVETGLLKWQAVQGQKYKPKKDTKGFESRRRDKIAYIRRIIEEAGDRILAKQRIDTIVEWIRDQNERLCKGEFDISEIIQSKSQKISYANKTQQQTVTENIRRREGDDVAPRPGDRVFFIYIKLAGKNVKSFECVEDPLYALTHNIPIDYQKIGESCVINATRRIVHLLIARDEKDPVKRAAIVEKTIAHMNEPFFKTYSTVDQAQGGPMVKFGALQPSCRICNVNLDKFTVNRIVKRPGMKVLCDDHADHYDTLLKEYDEKLRVAKQRSEDTWNFCGVCVGVKGNSKECPNADCDRYWKRIKFDNDLQHISEYVKRIDLSW
jgi:DNA polymerase elongation subunit (family B)